MDSVLVCTCAVFIALDNLTRIFVSACNGLSHVKRGRERGVHRHGMAQQQTPGKHSTRLMIRHNVSISRTIYISCWPLSSLHSQLHVVIQQTSKNIREHKYMSNYALGTRCTTCYPHVHITYAGKAVGKQPWVKQPREMTIWKIDRGQMYPPAALRPMCAGVPCANIAWGSATSIVRDWNLLSQECRTWWTSACSPIEPDTSHPHLLSRHLT